MGLWNRGPWKILNGIELILDDQGNLLDSYTIGLESFRPELFFTVSYSQQALVWFIMHNLNSNT